MIVIRSEPAGFTPEKFPSVIPSDSMPSLNADSTIVFGRLFSPESSKTLFAGDCT